MHTDVRTCTPGIFADQLKVQKDKAAQAEAAAQRTEEELLRLREEFNNHRRNKTVSLSERGLKSNRRWTAYEGVRCWLGEVAEAAQIVHGLTVAGE